ncbi:MAG: winged helix-turn-helix domain-containing protein, partial [Candidatus Dormibacteraceae bacterium]
VLPFLLGNQLVARVDLKADRQAKVLLVAAAHAEAETSHSTVAQELAIELHSMAGWLGLAGVAVSARGDLAPALQACLSP